MDIQRRIRGFDVYRERVEQLYNKSDNTRIDPNRRSRVS